MQNGTDKHAAYSIGTQVVHAGEHPRSDQSAAFPIYQSATFGADIDSDAAYDKVRYTRCNNNPTQLYTARKVAELEGAEAALVTASGMSAITTALLTLLSAGDHVLVQSCLYGGTYSLVHEVLPSMGISVTELAGDAPVELEGQSGKTNWDTLVRPNTKVVYVEAITNPMCVVTHLPGVIALAQRHNLRTIIDNTFCSPVNLRPLSLGFDLVVESATKYLNGHSDVVAGVLAGRQELVGKALQRLNVLGSTLDPHACYLLSRGIKTLSLRVQQQCRNAMALAEALSKHPQVERVHYPGLPSSPSHALASKLCRSGNPKGGFGGVLSFELKGGRPAADALQRALQIGFVAPSLGGVETLVTRPAGTSHKGQTPEQRESIGVTEGLLRIACGIEDPEDLVADFIQAANAAAQAANTSG